MELPTMTVRLRKSASKALANINEADFDPELHERLEPEKPPEPPPPAEPPRAGKK